jgi:hypothetical protein
MVVRVDVEPRLLTWAQERSRLDRADLTRRFPKLEAWEQREAKPTLKQLDSFAQATHTPAGFLLLSEPPQETVPIPDYRTIAGRGVGQPSADLLDTIFQCQQRQEWYHDYARVNGEPPVPLVGSLTPTTPPMDGAATMRSALQFEPSARGLELVRCAAHPRRTRRGARRARDDQRRRRQQHPPQARSRGVPGLRLGRRSRPPRVHQRCRHQGGADLHAGARARAPLVRVWARPRRPPRAWNHPSSHAIVASVSTSRIECIASASPATPSNATDL